MSRVFFMPAVWDEPGDLIRRKARKLLETLIEDMNLPAGLSMSYALEDHNRLQSEEQFLGWTVPLVDGLRARGHAMTSLAPVTEPDKTGVEVVVDEGGDTVSIAGRAHEAEGLFFSYRMACHPHSGLSGALSALALGCMSAQGKRALQADIQPTIARSVCGGCGLCITLCSRGAIRHTGHVAVMKPELCLVNGDCQTECHTGALTMPPRGGEIFQGRLAAAAAGAARGKEGRMLWLGF